MYTMLPFSLLISWTFLITDKVSESLEDPFEGGVHNVPISALARSFEIELRQTLVSDVNYLVRSATTILAG
jgi:putative membrane protein